MDFAQKKLTPCQFKLYTEKIFTKSLCNPAVHAKLTTQQHVETTVSVSIKDNHNETSTFFDLFYQATSSWTCLAALAQTVQGSHVTSTMPSEHFDNAKYWEVKVSIP